MLVKEFVENELLGFKNPSEIEKLIESITENGKYTLDFSDKDYYGAIKIHWGTNIFYDTNNKIDGYLAHELLHAELFKKGFPSPKDFYDNNKIEMLQRVIGEKSNRDIINCLAHSIFYPEYIKLGFLKNEFVTSEYQDLTENTDFEIFLSTYDKNNNHKNKGFIEKYISIETDIYSNILLGRCTKLNKLRKLKNVDVNLFAVLKKLSKTIQLEKDISKIEGIISEFYVEANEICC